MNDGVEDVSDALFSSNGYGQREEGFWLHPVFPTTLSYNEVLDHNAVTFSNFQRFPRGESVTSFSALVLDRSAVIIRSDKRPSISRVSTRISDVKVR